MAYQTWKDQQLVPVTSDKCGLKINKNILPNTYVVRDPKTKRASQMVTITDQGLYLGWDRCGTCSGSFKSCTCSTGLFHTRGVAWSVWYGEHGRTDRHTLTTDYEHLFDPHGKRSGNVTRDAFKGQLKPRTATKTPGPVLSDPVRQKSLKTPSTDVLGASDVPEIDVAAVDQAAKVEASRSKRKVRRTVLKGGR